jgi:hypothetical protein
MGKRLLFFGMAIAGSLAVAAPPVLAEQLSRSSSITLSGIVLPGRYIYLDSQGDIQKVIGNTSQNITPKVLSNNQLVPLSAKTARQYQYLLAENNGRLQASQTYLSDKYNPYILFAHWVQNNPYFSQKII